MYFFLQIVPRNDVGTYVLSTLFIPDRAFAAILATSTTATPALRKAMKKKITEKTECSWWRWWTFAIVNVMSYRLVLIMTMIWAKHIQTELFKTWDEAERKRIRLFSLHRRHGLPLPAGLDRRPEVATRVINWDWVLAPLPADLHHSQQLHYSCSNWVLLLSWVL